MFIVGGVVGVVSGVIGIAAIDHDEHSNYSDYSDHRNYSDSYYVMAIKEKKERLKAQQQEYSQLKSQLNEKYNDYLDVLEQEEELKPHFNELAGALRNNPNRFYNLAQEKLKEQIEADLVKDKKHLQNLDAMILKIQKLQLTKKK